MNELILVVEDETTIAASLQDDLDTEGYSVEVTGDGVDALHRILENKFHLILLDVMLPGMDGFDICREARAKGCRTPIIMLTAKSQEVDRVVGLELGADDYITKPFSRRELLARIKAVLRRSRETERTGGIYNFADITVDFDRCEVSKGDKRIGLTAMEIKLLRIFLEHRGQVLTIDELMQEGWGDNAVLTDRVIYTHVNNLRKKLEDDSHNPRHIIGVRGIGYRFDG